MSNIETTNNDRKATLKLSFAAYKDLAARKSTLQEEIDAINAEQSDLVATMAEAVGDAKSFVAEGRTLTPVVGGGKSKESNFLRGFAPKAPKAVKETLDLDSDA